MKNKKTNLFLALEQSFEEDVLNTYLKFSNYSAEDLIEIQTEAKGTYTTHPSEYVKIEDKIAKIPIVGVLYNHSDIVTWALNLTTYDEITEAIDYSLKEGVEKIIFNIESPGGFVQGVEKLARKISNLKIKTEAQVDYAASAAFLIASQTDKISASGSWVEVGSVGIIASVLDFTEAFKKEGIKNLIFTSTKAPKKFIDPTTEQGAKQIQARLDEYHELFTDLVSKGRNVSKSYIDENFGKGGTLMVSDALKVKMIDHIDKDEDEEFDQSNDKEFNLRKSAEKSAEEEKVMSEMTKKDSPHIEIEKGISKERKRVLALSGWAKTGNAEQRKIALEAIESGKTQDEILASLMAAQRATDSEANKEAAELAKENAPEIAVIEKSTDDKKEGEIKSLADSIVAEIKGVK